MSKDEEIPVEEQSLSHIRCAGRSTWGCRSVKCFQSCFIKWLARDMHTAIWKCNVTVNFCIIVIIKICLLSEIATKTYWNKFNLHSVIQQYCCVASQIGYRYLVCNPQYFYIANLNFCGEEWESWVYSQGADFTMTGKNDSPLPSSKADSQLSQ